MTAPKVLLPSERPSQPARREALFTARDLLLASLATPAAALLSSPAAAARAASALTVMHGFADLQGITLWLQGARAQSVRVELQAEGRVEAVVDVSLEAQADCAASIYIGALQSGTTYRYTVRPRSGREALASGTFKTQAHWQYRGDPPTIRIATGSCNYLNDGRYDRPGTPYGGGEGIFDAIAATTPDLMLWLGDNIYLRDPEWTSREGINRRYRFYRSHAAMRKLWQAAPHVAIWDDHDFGPDDSDASFVNREWSLQMFRRYWPLPYAPRRDGLYGMVTLGDVDIFMLDDRSYRYPNRWPADAPDKAMYGAAQMQWLKAALVYSRAPFKLVAGGTQFFNKVSRAEPGARYRGETWSNFPAEQESLRKFLDETRIPGVVFLSGDRHYAQMLRIERGPLYPLHELTTSPLTAGPIRDPGEAERNNPEMVPGTMYNDRNFALITVTGPRTRRAMAVELRDTAGNKVWEWQATAAQLAEGTRP
jgi:alkaline phosphatase D